MIPERHLEFARKTFQGVDEKAFLREMLYDGKYVPVDAQPDTVWYMPGQAMAQNHANVKNGPHRRRYMLVATAPNFVDHATHSHLKSEAGQLLRKALSDAKIALDDVYYTTVTKFPMPKQATAYRAGWLKDGWEYVLEEIALVRPEAIMFLGMEPTKMAYGNKSRLDEVRGQIHDFNGIPSMAAVSHLSFVSNAAGLGTLTKQLEAFRDIPFGKADILDGLEYPDRDYKVLWTLEDLKEEVAKEVEQGVLTFAVDVETGNDTGHPEDEYIISFQWSHGPGHARVVPLIVERPERMVDKLYTAGKNKGKPVLVDESVWCCEEEPPEGAKTYTDEATGQDYWVRQVPEQIPEFGGVGISRKCRADLVDWFDEAAKLITHMLTWCELTCLVGHNLRYDLSAMRDGFGLEVRQFCNGKRSWDTMLAAHILSKEDSFGLKELTLKYTDMGAYDAPMNKWCADNSGAGKLFPGDASLRFFHGYRDIALRYLLPYAMCDVDATYRLLETFGPMLEELGREKLKWLFYNVELPLQHPLMDVERYGMPADEERLIELGDAYRDKYESLIDELRDLINWNECTIDGVKYGPFNVNSPDQLQALLYKGPFKKLDKVLKTHALEKRGVYRCEITPILTTGKYPKKWEQVVAEGLELYNAPAAGADTLVKLSAGGENLPDKTKKVLELLKQISELKQFVQMFLCEPRYDTPTETGKPLYGKGLRGCINSRGRVCTRISVLSETGRWKHSEPNLANLPKNKEGNIEKIFGEKMPMVRTSFKAPDGYVIMEADYKSAELFILGFMSQDPAFMEVLDSGQDVHGYNAVKVFNLDCTPDEVAKKHKEKRSAVKAVVFGLVYGLSPTGLAENLTATLGRIVTIEEAKEIIDQFFTTYPKIKEFLDESKKACLELGYVETAFGRRRYFPGVTSLSKDKQAAAQREATNARIQGTVADMLNLACIKLDEIRYEHKIGELLQWELIVGIHDAALVLVKEENAETMASVLDYCMSACVEVPGTNGRHLAVDAQAGQRWQEFKDVPITKIA